MNQGFRIQTPRLVLLWGEAGPEPAGELPRLHEQTSYDVLLQSRTGERIALEHRDPNLLSDLRAANDGRLLWGTINFGSQVGRSEFALRVGETLERTFQVEVLPTKLDYLNDYEALLDETRDILAGLVLEYLRATFRPGGDAHTGRATSLEWLTLLRHTTDELERALDGIVRQPRWGLVRDSRPTRAERVARPDAALRRTVLRGAGTGRMLLLHGGTRVRERLEERRSRPTLDTPEHRWLASQVGRIRRGLARVRADQQNASPSPRRVRILEEIGALEQRFARLASTAPLVAAGGTPPPGFASLQLLRQPGYREAYRACLLLARGLHLEGGPVRLAVKDLHLLYEQWCYLALARLLAEQLGTPLPASQLLAVEENGLRVLLRRGRTHGIVLQNARKQRVTLTYNPRFGGASHLVPQRPDLLLEVDRPGKSPARLVLDAKYRVEVSPEFRARYGSPGPPEDALNSLHRYRDALGAAQCVALFPHREGEPGDFRGRRLHRSIECLGIGALPFLPGETRYVADWLQGALARREHNSTEQ